MKSIFLPALFLLVSCTTCDIPLGKYEPHMGSESSATLTLLAESYTLFFAHWEPSSHGGRAEMTEKGTWTCSGETLELDIGDESVNAELQKIGNNPLGLPATTQAIVFGASDQAALSNTIFYPVPID